MYLPAIYLPAMYLPAMPLRAEAYLFYRLAPVRRRRGRGTAHWGEEEKREGEEEKREGDYSLVVDSSR